MFTSQTVQYNVHQLSIGSNCNDNNNDIQHFIRVSQANYTLIVGDRLLDVLAKRCEEKGISGDIFVDGRKRPKHFKCVTGYVVQVAYMHYYHRHLNYFDGVFCV